MDGYWSVGATTTFTVTASSAGNTNVTLHYANAQGSARNMSIYVNGTKIKQTSLPTLANWDTWSDVAETLNLSSGSNTIAYKYDTGDTGNVNLDYILVAGGSSVLLSDGSFSSIHPSTTFTAGTSTLGQWYSQIGTGNATQAASGGNPGNFLQWGLYGNQMEVGIAAPASAQTWTVSFDYICPQAWGGPNFKVFALSNGQALPYAYGGAAAGTQLLSVTPALASAWSHVSYSVSVPAGKNVIALEWFGDVGQTTGIDNVKVTNP